jgi:DNA-binding winged helix-turn-helix (wHTH) protein
MNEVKNLPTVVRSRELRKHGMRIQLKEKPFQILEPLIESAGQVVRRKTLCEKLWPDTHVVFDHSLNTAINKLRSVLADLAQTSSIHDELRHAPASCTKSELPD